MRFSPHTNHGFTLIELIAVLAIMSVLAGLIVVGIRTIGAGPVAEAERLRSHLRYAQSLSLANNTATWSVQINADSYQLLHNAQPAPLAFPGERGATRILPPGVTITAGTGILTFDALGAPAETRNVVLSDGTQTATVTILGFTGMIP